MVIFNSKLLNYQSVRENGWFFWSMSFASHLLSDCFPFPSWKLTINWPAVFPGLELHTSQRLVLFQWFLSNPFQISIGFKCFSCYFMLIHVMDIYGWFLHRYFSSFLVSNQIRFVHIKRVSAAPEDSRNGMIWIFDMPSGTCTSALSCHSQQVRQRMAVAAFQLYGVILYPNIIEYNVNINRSI